MARDKRTRIDPGVKRNAGGKRAAGEPKHAKGAGKKRTFVPPSHANDERVVWHFGAMDLEGPYGWSKICRQELVALVKLMTQVERKTAKEFFGGAGGQRAAVGQTKRIPVGNISPDATQRLTELGYEDTDALWELRVAGAPRLWYLRYDLTACALWWDPDHAVCPSRRG